MLFCVVISFLFHQWIMILENNYKSFACVIFCVHIIFLLLYLHLSGSQNKGQKCEMGTQK